MKIIRNGIYCLLHTFVIAIFLTATTVMAQTAGIGTRTPAATNNTEVVTTAGNIIIDNTGKMGVLVANPLVALDFRSGTNQSVAIGMTNQTAAQAGAGALRYNPTPAIGVKGYLEYSDGTKWIGYFPYGKPHIVVMAEKTTQDVYIFEPGAIPTIGPQTNGMPQRTSAYLTNWTEKLDSDSGTPTNTFDPSTGEFIAPRDGVYFATFTFALQANYIKSWLATNANQTEAIWEVRDASGTIKQRVKTSNGYPSDTGSAYNTSGGTLISGSVCTVSVFMVKGDKLRPFSWISLADNEFNYAASSRPFDTTGGYNVLTIVEQ
ncbi:hypothetical protein [Pedobacter punctiformis]|uniref:C1q domain-containing protein n=1 Tax=Pedobacter punctiformis TaxID=3004097 RepID=A0ABT4LDE3_9SPHI|nr:hypothetical protein [Pedobacter sp. HCMS5-2]MCZ4245930.1 hypothetical protein [Pedobacter sp. HCMS5-2]